MRVLRIARVNLRGFLLAVSHPSHSFSLLRSLKGQSFLTNRRRGIKLSRWREKKSELDANRALRSTYLVLSQKVRGKWGRGGGGGGRARPYGECNFTPILINDRAKLRINPRSRYRQVLSSARDLHPWRRRVSGGTRVTSVYTGCLSINVHYLRSVTPRTKLSRKVLGHFVEGGYHLRPTFQYLT